MLSLLAISCQRPTVPPVFDASAQPRDAGAFSDDAKAIMDAPLNDGGHAIFDDASADAGHTSDSGASKPAPILSGSHQVLFFGNSYSYGNDLPALYQSIIDRTSLPHSPVRIESVLVGGARLVQHLAAVETSGSEANRWLLTGSVEDRDWDAVILQGQSQIPGFNAGNSDKVAGRNAAVSLAGYADELDATTVLFMTWGRRNGDQSNAHIFGDFLSMQDRLEAGYRLMKDAILAAGFRAVIAPVGVAFRLIYQDQVQQGRDPQESTNVFSELYASDGSHPSISGSFLIACVLWSTITGEKAAVISFVPSGLDTSRADYLKGFADRAIQLEHAR